MNKIIESKIKSLIFFLIFSTSLFSQIPNFQWAKQIGNNNNESVRDIKLDSDGNVYTVGFFRGVVDFDPSPVNSYTMQSNTSIYQDVFICKMNANGDFIWAKQFKGTDGFITYYDRLSLVLDCSGNAYIAGSFKGSVDFAPGPSSSYVLSQVAIGTTGSDIFVCKLKSSGNFVWAKHFKQGTLNCTDYCFGLAIDSINNVYTTGNFSGVVDFDPGSGIYNLSPNSSTYVVDVFVSKLDSNGVFKWAKNIGGSNQETSTDINIDKLGNIYLTGDFYSSTDMDPSPTTSYILNSTGQYDAFILKLNNLGDFLWAKKFGGSVGSGGGVNSSSSIKTDRQGNVYASGTFQGTADFDPSPSATYTLSTATGSTSANSDIYILKLTSSGNLIWAKSLPGDYNPSYNSLDGRVELDSLENIYVAGTFRGTFDFDPSLAYTYTLTSSNYDGFMSKLDNNGALLWVRQWGGSLGDGIEGIAISNNNNDIFATGYFKSTVDFDPNSGVFNLTAPSDDVFIFKMSQSIVTNILSNNSNPQQLYIYPNPTNGVFNISVNNINSSELNISIVDIQGKEVYRESDKITNVTYNKQFNLTHLSKGMYYVKLSTDNETSVRKLIIQ